MEKNIVDQVFGEMEYKHRWVKRQQVQFFGKPSEVQIVAAAYTGQEICEEQRKSYQYFQENQEKILKVFSEKLQSYVDDNTKMISEYYDLKQGTESDKLVTPKTIYFDRDGKVVVLCDVKWDEENGLGVEVYPEIQIGRQDEFL